MRLIRCTLLVQLLILADYYRSSTALRGKVEVVDSSNKNYTFVVAVQVEDTGKVVCTGSLITKKHVLTTKRCLGVHQLNELEVAAGDYDRALGMKYQIAEVTSYHQWYEDKISKTELWRRSPEDINVLTLWIPVDGVKVAHLKYGSAWALQNKNVEILGWGETDDSDQDSLRRCFVQLLSPTHCKTQVYGIILQNIYTSERDHICSFSRTQTCRLSGGDEGGPMVMNGEVIGIALRMAVDDGVDRLFMPSLHLDVYHYKDFINSFVIAQAQVGSDHDNDDDEHCLRD